MSPLRNSLLCGALLLAGCQAAPAADALGDVAPRTKLGVMSSLPLYWPLAADMAAVANGSAEVPWQRQALERDFVIEPLDTLAPIPALSPDAPATDPLKGLTQLAVIQPRGLSPADNVALDGWVRGGGHLLLVLDPMLTGEYDVPLGDPRHPAGSALIPAVVARWGLTLRFDPDAEVAMSDARLGETSFVLDLAGHVAITDPAAAQCMLLAGDASARCQVGEGQVTLIADAALFEHPELAGGSGAALRAVVRAALE